MRKVSVIMPCFNQARFVAESVNSILGQTEVDLELIIVDDCSCDNSWETIRSAAARDSRVKANRHARNQGASKSRNDGLRIATGQFIGFCDADDVWERKKLDIQVNLLRNNPEYDVLYCDTLIIDEHGLPNGTRFSQRFPPPKLSSGSLFGDLVMRNFINMQSVLIRKECVESTGYFDEGIKWVEDWWYWIRLSRDHRFLYCSEPLARYRVHRGSTNLVQKRGYRVNRLKVFRRILQQYTDLPHYARANITFQMGVELCHLGKYRVGRRILWETVVTSAKDMRSFGSSCRALRRLMLNTKTLHQNTRSSHPM